jgi:hypothetical protein
MSLDSSTGTVTGYVLDGWGLILSRGTDQTSSGVTPALYPMGNRVSFPEGKTAGA